MKHIQRTCTSSTHEIYIPLSCKGFSLVSRLVYFEGLFFYHSYLVAMLYLMIRIDNCYNIKAVLRYIYGLLTHLAQKKLSQLVMFVSFVSFAVS